MKGARVVGDTIAGCTIGGDNVDLGSGRRSNRGATTNEEIGLGAKGSERAEEEESGKGKAHQKPQ